MQHSEDLEFQRQRINRHIVGCLPINTVLSRWTPMYFNDVTKDNEMIQRLTAVITEASENHLQTRRIVNLVQASGTGKSHLGIQYAKLHGGIVISFASGVHKQILNEAQTAIQNLKPKQVENNVASYEDEMEYLKASIRVMSLIPLTFIEFAVLFFPIAREYFRAQNPSLDGTVLEQQVRAAFLRATLDTEKIALLELFKSNVKFYGNESTYTVFFNNMVANAKQEQIKAIFYDEVHMLVNSCRGLFCHAPGQDYNADEIMARLKFERQSGGKDIKEHSFSRSTSLMYLQVLVMEELTHNFIGSVTSSSSYSAVLYPKADGSEFSRGRLAVTHLVPYEKDEIRLNRAVEQLLVAFGPNVTQELKKHELTLKHLSSRSAYLWDLFAKIKDLPTLKDTITVAVNAAKEEAQILAGDYFTRLLRSDVPKDVQKEIESTSIKIWVGEQTIQLSQPTLMMCVMKSAIITEEPLKDAYKLQYSLSETENLQAMQSFSARVFDPYVQQQMIKSVTLDVFFQHVKFNAIENPGQAGEYYCQAQLMLRYSDALLLDIKGPAGVVQKSPCASLKLPKFMLPKTLTTAGITEDYKIIEHFPQFQSFYYKPGASFHPDAVVHLLNGDNAAGLLLIQSKNREDIMSPSGLVKALASLEPSNFYSGAKNKKGRWVEIMKRKNLQRLHWVRLLYARGFGGNVVKAVQEYNASRAGRKYPIILMTPPKEDVPNRPAFLAPIASQPVETISKDSLKLLLKLMTMHFDEKKFADASLAYSPSLAQRTIASLLTQLEKLSQQGMQ